MCRPVDWIKKWFLRKRKADGKNRTLFPTEPTFVENESPAHDDKALGHAHSKFWSMDAFAAADSTNFSPSVGRIPKFYGHHGRSFLSSSIIIGVFSSQGNEEERAISSSGTSAETGYGYVTQSDSVLIDEHARATTPASYDLREVLLGADAFTGYVSPSASVDASGSPTSEHPNVALIIDELLSVVSSPEPSMYSDNPFDERLFHSESITDLELTTTNYSDPSMTSSINSLDEFILVSDDLDSNSTTSCSTSDDLGLGAFDSTTGCANLGLGSSPGFMTSILGEPSVFYESLLFPGKQDPIGDSVDVCLGAGADHVVFVLTGIEIC